MKIYKFRGLLKKELKSPYFVFWYYFYYFKYFVIRFFMNVK